MGKAATTMFASYTDSQAQMSAGKFNRDQARRNAGLMSLQAQEIEERGQKESNLHRRKVRGMVGSQRAALAAQGIDVGSGTALDVQGETAYLGEMDAQQIKENAMLEAYGLRSKARNLMSQSRYDYKAAKFGSRATLLAGGMKAATQAAEEYSSGGYGG
jgi:hypothetical protein